MEQTNLYIEKKVNEALYVTLPKYTICEVFKGNSKAVSKINQKNLSFTTFPPMLHYKCFIYSHVLYLSQTIHRGNQTPFHSQV